MSSELSPEQIAQIDSIELPCLRRIIHGLGSEPRVHISFPDDLTEDVVEYWEVNPHTLERSLILRWTLEEELSASASN